MQTARRKIEFYNYPLCIDIAQRELAHQAAGLNKQTTYGMADLERAS